MAPDTLAAALAVLTLPVPVGILYRRRRAIRRVIAVEVFRRDRARSTYRDARRQYRHARARYRQAKREATRNYYRRK